MVFDSFTCSATDFWASSRDEPVPDWFCESADLAELAAKTGIDADGLARTVEEWNRHVAARRRSRLRPRLQRLRRLLG